jgi:hypothetical protein
MVLFLKIKNPSMRYGRYIFYSNEAYVVATHKSGVLFFSFGHGFFYSGCIMLFMFGRNLRKIY